MLTPTSRRHLTGMALIAALLIAGLSTAAGKGRSPPPPPADNPTPIQIFGVWHCGSHFCDWNEVIDMSAFDKANRWLIDRGDGKPAVNLVVLSFVNPLQLLYGTDTESRVPQGMTTKVISYFTDRGIRVMLSIGGITYTDDWDAALTASADSPTTLGLHAAQAAKDLGVGIEIDYENSSSPNIAALEKFISAYRSVLPYDPTGTTAAARLTIDVAAGDRWLIDLNRYATQNWLNPDNPVLDYANAMVSGTSSGTPTDWQEHVDGKPQYAPPVLPLAPARFTGALYLKGNNANCLNFAASEQNADSDYVQRVLPNATKFPIEQGFTPGMLGYMFWAAGTPSARRSYVPTTDCTGGMGIAADIFKIDTPMPTLRQR